MRQRRIVQETDGTKNFSRDLVQSMKEAAAFVEGEKTGARVHVVAVPDVRATFTPPTKRRR
jgi:hypothetical protein